MPASTSEATPGSTESNVEIKTIIDLLRLDSDANPWIVDKLLRRGAQVLLAGPPKSGKSLVANDIALAIARPFKKDEVRYLFGHGVKPPGKDEGMS
jgi:RecA-family ATPase